MKILVIDDHPLFADGLKQVLESMLCEVQAFQATSAEMALESIDSGQSLDMILVDFALPGLDGVEFLRLLRDRQIWVPTVLISAHEEASIVLKALDAGALGFIPKSYPSSELIEALQTVLAGDVFLPSNIKRQVELLRRVEAGLRPSDELARAFGITPKQYQVLELLAEGWPNRQMAKVLNLSEHTIKSHLKVLYSVLQVENRVQCIKRAEQMGLITQNRDVDQPTVS